MGRIAVQNVAVVAADTVGAINAESLNNIVKTLVAHPSRILLAEKIVAGPKYFEAKAPMKRDWYHKTIIYMSSVPKSDLRACILEVAKRGKFKTTMNEETLRRLDQQYNLGGIERLVMYLIQYDKQMAIPKFAHYRPLLKDLIVSAIEASPFLASVVIDAQGRVNFRIFEFKDEQDGCWTSVNCVWTQTKIAIPDDYVIKVNDPKWTFAENYSVYTARLRGRRTDEHVYRLFEEQDQHVAFTAEVLEPYRASALAKHRSTMISELKEMGVNDRPESFEDLRASV